MPHQHQAFRRILVEINFVAFGQDKHRTEFFYDCTVEQASKEVWKICPTAVILYAWQYGLHEAVQIKISKKKLNDEELTNFYKGKEEDE